MKSAEIRVIHEPPQVENRPAVLIRTGGGNAPSLMGLRVLDRINANRAAQGLTQVNGIFPAANERQVGILQSEATDASRVLVDTTYASMIEPYTSSHGRFRDHVDVVGTQGDATKTELMQRFGTDASDFEAMSVGLGESVTHSPRDIIGVIDMGSRYPFTEHPDHYFLFPVLASELWQNFREEQLHYDPSIKISDESLARAIGKMQEVENGYKKIFLPQIHSFSYLYVPEGASIDEKIAALDAQPRIKGEIPVEYTPPMSPNLSHELSTEKIKESSIFVVFSGTGSASAETNKVISQIANAGYRVLVPESAVEYGDVTEVNKDNVTVVSSFNVISHPNVHGILARPGFGSIWDTQNAGIEIMRPPHVPGDDHEMVVNGRTIDAIGIGEEMNPDTPTDPENFKRARRIYTHQARLLKVRQTEKFGTSDGLSYVADAITQELVQSTNS